MSGLDKASRWGVGTESVVVRVALVQGVLLVGEFGGLVKATRGDGTTLEGRMEALVVKTFSTGQEMVFRAGYWVKSKETRDGLSPAYKAFEALELKAGEGVAVEVEIEAGKYLNYDAVGAFRLPDKGLVSGVLGGADGARASGVAAK
jgi:hypothetical protein